MEAIINEGSQGEQTVICVEDNQFNFYMNRRASKNQIHLSGSQLILTTLPNYLQTI